MKSANSKKKSIPPNLQHLRRAAIHKLKPDGKDERYA